MQKQIGIGSAYDLLTALKHQELSVRAATIRAVAADPRKATALCLDEGMDLFAELATLLAATPEAGLRAGYVLAILQLEDERRMAFAKEMFLAADDAKIILLSSEWIASLPEQERQAFLEPVLLARDSPTKSRAAANLLVGCRNLPPRVSLRIALLSDHQIATPLLDEESLAPWLQELQGPYALTARRLFIKKHPDGAAALLPFWQRLDDDICLWVLRTTPAEAREKHAAIITEILSSTRDKLLPAALDWWPSSAVTDELEESCLEPLYRHPDPQVRAAAVNAGTGPLNWSLFLDSEEDDRVRQALIQRIAASKDPSALVLLPALAADSNWRIRARTTAALVALFPQSRQLLQSMLSHDSEQVRSCAIQALATVNQDEFIAPALARSDQRSTQVKASGP